MIHGTSLLSMYAGAMNTNVAMGYEMMCFMVVDWFAGIEPALMI
jgi:hypothetical protein